MSATPLHRNRNRLIAALALLVAGISLIGTVALPHASRTAAREDAAAAAAALDRYFGNRNDLADAEQRIRRALERDPECTEAWVEHARLRLKRDGSDPGSLSAAEQDLRTGLRSQPDHGNAHVLLGYVLTHQRRFNEAVSTFARARALGATSPWLDINAAQLHLLRDGAQAAAPIYRKALARPDLPMRARIGAVDDIGRALADAGEAQQARALYEELFAKEEGRTAWGMGNFSGILRTRLLDIDASEAWGRRALEMMDYRAGRENLGKTLYLAWAEALIEAKDEAKAADIYAEAKTYKESPVDLLFEMGSYPRAHPIVAALAARGVPLDYREELGRGRGTPPLMTLIADDNVAVAAALLDAGAHVDERGNSGTTALIIAAEFGKTGMTKLLLSRGANPGARNREGLTAEEAARRNGREETASILAAARLAAGQPSRPPL